MANSRKNMLYRGRKQEVREPRQRFLICCEGKKTEPQYFEKFKVSAEVIVCGEGAVTSSLVQRAIEKSKAENYDQVWCVFDRDSNSKKSFTDALALAEKNGFKVAYSVQAFEIWYLLHFNYHDTSLSRKDYCKKLTEYLGCKYEKRDDAIYEKLLSKQPQAIKWAKKLFNSYKRSANPHDNDPSTTVHLLVEELDKFSRK